MLPGQCDQFSQVPDRRIAGPYDAREAERTLAYLVVSDVLFCISAFLWDCEDLKQHGACENTSAIVLFVQRKNCPDPLKGSERPGNSLLSPM